jgi:hypothetical protein
MKLEYTEGEIRMATLVALNASKTGTLTTTELIIVLSASMNPRGTDAQIARERNDTYFSQKVRNLISHRDGETSLMSRDYVVYDGANETLTITVPGQDLCTI